MSGRRGFSLVEMVIVLVLAGIVSVAAISMMTTQNRFNEAMTALGESQENARSAMQLVAAELRGLSNGSIVEAGSDRLVIRLPATIGIVCAQGQGPGRWHAFFPLDEEIDPDALGLAARGPGGGWDFDVGRVSLTFEGGAGRQACIDEGGGQIGESDEYATLTVRGQSGGGGGPDFDELPGQGGDHGQGHGPGAGPQGQGLGLLRNRTRVEVVLGSALMLFDEVGYHFAPSTLNPGQRAFYRGAPGTIGVELAQGFASSSGFEYRLAGENDWRASVNDGQVDRIVAVRVTAEVDAHGTSGTATRSPTFSLVREIPIGGSL